MDFTSAKAAIKSPLLETSIDGAKAVLINVTGSDLGLFEVNEAADLIREAVDSDANIIFGAGLDDTLKDDIKITVIATGFDATKAQRFNSETKQEKKSDDSGELVIPTFLRRKEF